MVYEIKSYFDAKDLPDIEALLPDPAADFWKETYHRLAEAYMWEPYLAGGIVQKGLSQLREALPLNLKYDYSFGIAARKKTKYLKNGNPELVHLVNLISMSDKSAYKCARITKTLTKLCEMESVAKEIIDSGGFELICDFIKTGRTPVYYYKLLLALCQHEGLNEQLISRPQFIPTMQELIESKVNQADAVAYGVLRQLIRNVEIGGKIYYSEDFESLREIIEKNKDKSQKLRTLSKCVNDKLRYLPALITNLPTRKCFTMSLEELPSTLAQFAITGLAGAIYCGLRWKAKFPSLSWSFFSRKIAFGFAGAASPFIIRFTSHIMYSENTKLAIENRAFGRSTNKLAAPATLLIADAVRWSLFLTLFFTSWYYGKYLLLPSVVGGLFHILKIPTVNDVSNGNYLKMKF
eukprot:Phypoly_transcript_06983.p1 GENE.Phypoly_transcript_06983~~Phypoly_transcript_06983.p1  ORF type:complete len:407 (+),score=49.61 Phypoly_transcript_06983:482-1702(+)